MFVITKPDKIDYQSVASKSEENNSKNGEKMEDGLNLKKRRFKFGMCR